jgi:hypothetical protein
MVLVVEVGDWKTSSLASVKLPFLAKAIKENYVRKWPNFSAKTYIRL